MELEIERIEPHWYHGFANSPSIHIYLAAPLKLHNGGNLEWLYAPVPDATKREKTMLLSTNNAPWVKFVYIDNPDGNPSMDGALGGEYKLTNGEVLNSRTGWSSRSGVLNRNYADFLEDELAEVTLFEPGWSIGWAGFNVYAQYLKNHEKWPRDLYLVREIKFNEEPYWYISTNPTKVVKGPK